ncbi:MAG: HAD family hydrolase [Candidatus Omnitrophota bacterium]
MTRKIEKKLFIFDLDGTLADAYRAIEKSLNFALEKFAYKPVAFSEVKKKVGGGDRLFIEEFFLPKDVEPALAIYRRDHKETLKAYSRCRPYAKMLLLRLRRRGKKIAIASNRPFAYTDIVLKKTGIKKYIDDTLCADMVKRRKPHPEMLRLLLKRFRLKPKEAVYIGDMAIDLEAARRGRIDALFVSGGSGTKQEARKFKKVKIVSSLKEVLSIYA